LDSLPAQLLPSGPCALASIPGLFLDGLQALHQAGELQFFTDLAGLESTAAFSAWLAPLRKSEWVVYAKRPFAGPSQVLAYLARYTHRIAISNSRILSLRDGRVSFRWKDYRQDGKAKVMTLAAVEFIRRFLLHVLPDGFHRIRHYGLFANGHRAEKLTLCRNLLDADPVANATTPGAATVESEDDRRLCPCCGGQMKIIETFDGTSTRSHYAFDSS
jgi:Putative transposase